ncbi:EamA domain-containing membrane protein RarD [Daejeonella rubra]|uniref:EamA domain-containing membrane protein RarD n=1 Tax=Daejeonella rubra TaxID=990371 RepID=A0A1G9QKE2_9SPHI|nr:DMT family transporter [Daejeonella rubra]SDM10745.1 EamA domain-containing membrane protein RarD [Daejeonella rubra]
MPSSKSPVSRNLVILHITVFIWGFTGILGALISIDATYLVWYRVLIAFVSLYAYFVYKKIPISVSKETFLKLFFTGAIVALHWILFFQSIKSSTVSVALVSLSSLTLFTAILEPILKKQRISKLEILTGLLIISGIYMIFKFESRYSVGIICGLLSAFCASIFSIINSKQIQNRPAAIISFYELIGAWVWVSVYLLISEGFKAPVSLNPTDLAFLFILGTVCTSVAYVSGVAVMKELSAFRVALITNLEPVYGIILAFLFFGKREQMTIGFYAGALVILSTIFMFPYIKNMKRKKISK